MQNINEKTKIKKLFRNTMRVIMVVLILFNCITFAYNANEKIQVELVEVIDGDTAKVEYNGEIVTLRFLAVDTPETKYSKWGEEPYGPEASAFSKKVLTEADKLEIEFDENSDKQDNYDRYLVWLWVDDVLMQELLIKNGLGEVAYLYGDYKYTETLKTLQEKAKRYSIGMWGGNKLEEIVKKEEDASNITQKNEIEINNNQEELIPNITTKHEYIYEDDIEKSESIYTTIITGAVIVLLLVIKEVLRSKKINK